MTARRLACALAIVCACAGPEPEPEPLIAPEGSLLRDPLMDPLPERLSEVGLYLALPSREVVPDAALGYAPRYPLWTNGSDKSRFLVLPEGETIDNRADPWGFPPGTLVFKTFAYAERAVETRLLRKTADGEWDYAVYLWLEDGSDATLLDIDLPVPVSIGAPIGTHTIPARLDCRTCHESADAEVIGFDALQLGEAITDLDARGVFRVAPELVAPIEHEDETTARVLQWLHADCVHCHNGGDGSSSSFDLRADVALANLIGVESTDSGSAGGVRVIPGNPSESLMFRAFAGEGDVDGVKAMPPLGVDVRDAASVELVREWIEALR